MKPQYNKGGFKGKKFGRDDRFGGKKKSFGKSWGRDREERSEMFSATCSECYNSCEVPFKPNGRKPVLCNDCFRGGDDRGPKPRFERERRDDRYDNRRDDRRDFRKPAYQKESRESDEALKKQIKALDAKVTQILQILESIEIVHPTDEL